jgi:recombination protein RecT
MSVRAQAEVDSSDQRRRNEVSEESAVSTREQGAVAIARQPRDIKDLLQSDQFKSAVASALPRCLKPDRFIRVALNATMRQPELLQCSKESFFRAMLDLSAYGLEPNGRDAHLIPFNNKIKYEDEGGKQRERWEKQVQLIIDYKGLVVLVRRSGDVSYIHADTVYEKDTFEFQYGSEAKLRHVPRFEDRGSKVIAAYSFVKLRDGSEDFMILGKSEIDAVRKRSKSGNAGPWSTDWDEMAKKTAFRRHSKWLPFSPEVQEVIRADEEADLVDVGGLSLLGEQADSIRGSVSLESLSASGDANRGHGATQSLTEAEMSAQQAAHDKE